MVEIIIIEHGTKRRISLTGNLAMVVISGGCEGEVACLAGSENKAEALELLGKIRQTVEDSSLDHLN